MFCELKFDQNELQIKSISSSYLYLNRPPLGGTYKSVVNHEHQMVYVFGREEEERKKRKVRFEFFV